MASYLLSLQFDKSGCTDKRVINLGGVSFNSKSPLGITAYFNPFNIDSGLMITDSKIKDVLTSGNSWCIYFKYKVNKSDLINITPIIVYQNDTIIKNFLTIENYNNFTLYIDDAPYKSGDISYSFDNEWHTFYLYYKDKSIFFYIDGYEDLYYNNIGTASFGDTIFIGVNIYTNTNYCGYINDFNIFKGVIYRRSFVPPSEYIYTADVITNYKNLSYLNKEDFEEELIDSIEHNREYAANRLIEYQKNYTPRRLNITWHQIDDGYFDSYEYKYNTDLENLYYIHINITGIDTNLLTKDDKYFSNNLETALEMNKVHPLMIFIDKKLVRLSKIKLIKSDGWYTLVIKDMPKKYKVKTLDIILLPFAVIYEEDYGERFDLEPLYSFDKEGRFVPSSNGHTYYYIDKEKDDNIRHIGIREYYYNTIQNSKEEDYLKFVWRYGRLEITRVTEDNGAFMQFRAGSYGYIKPGDNVVLYTGSTIINPSLYKIIGYDLIYFYNLDDVAIFEGRTVTMQIITDINDSKERMLSKDYTNIQIVEVSATQHNQSMFKIPDVYDEKGNQYRKFLLFKGHILMEDKDRYIIDYDTNTITLTDKKDYLPAGSNLLFIFVGLEKMDARGRLFTKPIFYYALPNEDDKTKASIQTNDVVLKKNNSIIFVNGTFISPYRYTIENNIICMKEYEFSETANIILITLKTIDELEDPYSWRSRIIYNELAKGKRYVLYDLSIQKEIKISLNNLLCFDNDGYLITDLIGSIYNYNIIKQLKTSEHLERVVRYLTCVYRTDGFSNKANLIRLGNEHFMKEYILGREEFYEMDEHFDELLSDFEFSHRRDKSYGENLSKSLDYILSYNQNKIDDVYEKTSTAFIKNYNTEKFNASLIRNENGTYSLSIPRDEYDTNKRRTFPLFFVNGTLADWDIDESANNTIVTLNNRLPASSKLKSINFKGLSNFLYELLQNDENVRLRSDKNANYYIHARLTTGNEVSSEFYASVMVTDEIIKDIPCSIDVNDVFLPEPVHWKFEEDLFKCTIAVKEDIHKDIVSIINVIHDHSAQIDIEKLANEGNYIDVFVRMDVE